MTEFSHDGTGSQHPQTGLQHGQTSTIVAQATPQGNGAIAIVRISGPMAKQLLARLFTPLKRGFEDFEPWKVYFGIFHDLQGARIDEVLCFCMRAPHSYTGEDCAEIHCHGGQVIVSLILETLLAAGAEPARRGEFTRRAFLNGRVDLSQAEAVAEMIAAPSRAALRQSLRRLDGELGRRVGKVREELDWVRMNMSLAVDFPDDEVEILSRQDFLARVNDARTAMQDLLRSFERARVHSSGARVVLAGQVNAGKSSLMNALLGKNRALVTDIPGTTRDFLEEGLLLNDLPVRLVDTAGMRESTDTVEVLGIERSREQIQEAELLVIVVDGALLGPNGALGDTCPDETTQMLLSTTTSTVLVVWNKADVCMPVFPEGLDRPAWCRTKAGPADFICVSALTGFNLDAACDAMVSLVLRSLPGEEDSLAPNDRQAHALHAACRELDELARDIEAGQLYDLLSVHLDMCCSFLDDVIGVGTAQDVLNHVFESFCIGK